MRGRGLRLRRLISLGGVCRAVSPRRVGGGMWLRLSLVARRSPGLGLKGIIALRIAGRVRGGGRRCGRRRWKVRCRCWSMSGRFSRIAAGRERSTSISLPVPVSPAAISPAPFTPFVVVAALSVPTFFLSMRLERRRRRTGGSA